MKIKKIVAAKKILEYIFLEKPTFFKGRDIMRRKNYFNNMNDINLGISLLIERGYIRAKQNNPKGKYIAGRPQSKEYEVNPIILKTV
jgi:hypothetical protein